MQPSTVLAQSNSDPQATFLRHALRHTARKGHALINLGETADHVGCILEGSAEVISCDLNGNEMVLAYLYPGDFYGLLTLSDPCAAHTTSVVARQNCVVAEISQRRLDVLLNAHPEVYRLLLRQLGKQLNDTQQAVMELMHYDVTQRLALTLSRLAQGPDGANHPDGKQLRMTRIELGRVIGCTREMIGRAIQRLKDAGLLKSRGRTLVIHQNLLDAEGDLEMVRDMPVWRGKAAA